MVDIMQQLLEHLWELECQAKNKGDPKEMPDEWLHGGFLLFIVHGPPGGNCAGVLSHKGSNGPSAGL